MAGIRLALCQLNPTVGDIGGNAGKQEQEYGYKGLGPSPQHAPFFSGASQPPLQPQPQPVCFLKKNRRMT